jgi:hypothetical protein
MTLTAFAEKWGVDYSTAKRWRKDGLVVPAHGPVDVAKSEKRLAERPAQNRGGFAKGPIADDAATSSGTALAEAKRVRMTFEALLAEAHAEKQANAIVATGPAIDTVAADMAAIKKRFREIPAHVAPRLVDVDTAPEAHAVIYRGVCVALGDISGQPVHDATSKYLKPGEESTILENERTLYHVDVDGVCHYIRKPQDEIERNDRHAHAYADSLAKRSTIAVATLERGNDGATIVVKPARELSMFLRQAERERKRDAA